MAGYAGRFVRGLVAMLWSDSDCLLFWESLTATQNVQNKAFLSTLQCKVLAQTCTYDRILSLYYILCVFRQFYDETSPVEAIYSTILTFMSPNGRHICFSARFNIC